MSVNIYIRSVLFVFLQYVLYNYVQEIETESGRGFAIQKIYMYFTKVSIIRTCFFRVRDTYNYIYPIWSVRSN